MAAALLASCLTAAPALASVATIAAPWPGGVDVDYQLGGAYSPAPSVGIVVRDRTEDAEPGAYNVCYVNAFQTQPDQDRFWSKRARLLLRDGAGEPVVDEAWGETLLDIRTPGKRKKLARIVGRWIDGCARDGFDAVEFDNLDSFSRSSGLVRPKHAKAFAAALVKRSHRAGILAGQKNWAGMDNSRVGFDFAVTESCGRWDECDLYAAEYGDSVLAIEYADEDFTRTCTSHGAQWPVVLADRELTPTGVRRWC